MGILKNYEARKESEMLKRFWKTLKTALIAIGLLLSFFAVVELLRAYQTLYEFHPVVGNIFLFFLCCGLLWIVGYFVVTTILRPSVLKPPAITNPNAPTDRELRRYVKYLIKYIGRLAKNESLAPEEINIANNAMKQLATVLQNKNDCEALLSTVENTEEMKLKPLLAKLCQQAEKQVRDSTRDVMAAVAFSPYKSIDLIVVIYRNLLMVSRIVKVYNSRPRLRELMRVLSDVVNVIAAVNYLNMGKNLIEELGSNVPFAGKYMDDIAQGIGAGFMTSVAGHATIHRCQAFKSWDVTEARASIRNLAGNFYSDVRDIFFKDTLPLIKNRLGDVSARQWEKIKTGVGFALDETGKVIGRFIKEPIVNAGSSVAKAGTTGGRAVVKAVNNSFSIAGKNAKKVGLRIYKIFKFARIKIGSYSKRETR